MYNLIGDRGLSSLAATAEKLGNLAQLGKQAPPTPQQKDPDSIVELLNQITSVALRSQSTGKDIVHALCGTEIGTNAPGQDTEVEVVWSVQDKLYKILLLVSDIMTDHDRARAALGI